MDAYNSTSFRRLIDGLMLIKITSIWGLCRHRGVSWCPVDRSTRSVQGSIWGWVWIISRQRDGWTAEETCIRVQCGWEQSVADTHWQWLLCVLGRKWRSREKFALHFHYSIIGRHLKNWRFTTSPSGSWQIHLRHPSLVNVQGNWFPATIP